MTTMSSSKEPLSRANVRHLAHIRAPDKINSLDSGAVLDRFKEIKQYLEEAAGMGTLLDPEHTRPEIIPLPDPSQQVPRPEFVPQFLPEDETPLPEDPENPTRDELKAIEMAERAHAKKHEAWKQQMAVYSQDMSNFERARRAHVDSKRYAEAYDKEQKAAIGAFRSFHAKHQFAMIEDTEPFKSSRTLLNAFAAAETVYLRQEKTGFQSASWYARALNSVVQPSNVESIEAWETFHAEWKACFETSKILKTAYDDKEEGLGEKAVPILISQLLCWAIARSVPLEGSSSLHNRLVHIRQQLEEKGCAAFGGHHQTLEHLAGVINTSKAEKERSQTSDFKVTRVRFKSTNFIDGYTPHAT